MGSSELTYWWTIELGSFDHGGNKLCSDKSCCLGNSEASSMSGNVFVSLHAFGTI